MIKMKELEEILKKLEKSGDVIIGKDINKISIYLQDIDGFDESYEQIRREYQHQELVKKLIKILQNYELIDDDLYKVYKVEDQIIQLGYASYEI